MAQAARIVPTEDRTSRRATREVAGSGSAQTAPVLTVIHGGQGRYVRVAVFTVAAVTLMLGAVAGRAYMAEQQIKLDRLNSDVRRARDHFDSLRAERAELQSPEVLISKARSMGLVPSLGNRVVSVSPELAAAVVSSVGVIDDDIGDDVSSALDEFGRIKATVGGG